MKNKVRVGIISGIAILLGLTMVFTVPKMMDKSQDSPSSEYTASVMAPNSLGPTPDYYAGPPAVNDTVKNNLFLESWYNASKTQEKLQAELITNRGIITSTVGNSWGLKQYQVKGKTQSHVLSGTKFVPMIGDMILFDYKDMMRTEETGERLVFVPTAADASFRKENVAKFNKLLKDEQRPANHAERKTNLSEMTSRVSEVKPTHNLYIDGVETAINPGKYGMISVNELCKYMPYSLKIGEESITATGFELTTASGTHVITFINSGVGTSVDKVLFDGAASQLNPASVSFGADVPGEIKMYIADFPAYFGFDVEIYPTLDIMHIVTDDVNILKEENIRQANIETEAAYNERLLKLTPPTVPPASSSTVSRPSNTELLTPDNYDPSKFSRVYEDYDLTKWTLRDKIKYRIINDSSEGKQKMYKMEDWLDIMDEEEWIGRAASGNLYTPNQYADARKAIEGIAKQSEAIANETDAQRAARIKADEKRWVDAGGLEALKAELDAKIARGE